MKYLGCLLAVAFFITAFQTADSYKKLSLNDYKGVPDSNSHFLASTKCSIPFKIIQKIACADPNLITIKIAIKNVVDSTSWIKLNKVDHEQLVELLSHEQGHYDINEMFKIDFENKIKGECFHKNNLFAELKAIQTPIFLHYDSLQKKYDWETDHMNNKTKQEEWKVNIRNTLAEKIKSTE